MKEKNMEKRALIEAILFMYGKEVSFERITDFVYISEQEVRECLVVLQSEYASRKTGLHILITDHAAQMVTHPDVSAVIEQMTRKEIEGPLTPVAMEVLSIIAYRGPINKADIEAIRGVNCSFTIRNLVRRGLIERVQDDTGKRSHLYHITIDLLRILGIDSVGDLPEFVELSTDKRIDAILIRENMTEDKIN